MERIYVSTSRQKIRYMILQHTQGSHLGSNCLASEDLKYDDLDQELGPLLVHTELIHFRYQGCTIQHRQVKYYYPGYHHSPITLQAAVGVSTRCWAARSSLRALLSTRWGPLVSTGRGVCSILRDGPRYSYAVQVVGHAGCHERCINAVWARGVGAGDGHLCAQSRHEC